MEFTSPTTALVTEEETQRTVTTGFSQLINSSSADVDSSIIPT